MQHPPQKTQFADHWFLTGPTAGGKTALSLELARTLNAEIVSMDSMALFRQMDIGTAKPSAADRAAIPHHLLDVVDPHEDFSLADYLRLAEKTCAEIKSRGKQVLFVGGTPLYLKALLCGVFEGPPADWELRNKWQAFASAHGNGALHAELAKIDPLTAQRLAPQDVRRIIRAIEVFTKTGESITNLQKQFDIDRSPDQCRVYLLSWDREELNQRINARVESMFAAGWLEEAKSLFLAPQPLSRTATQAVGYQEIFKHFRGEQTLKETIIKIQTQTRQFAKRQRTWFRSLTECRSVPMTSQSAPLAVAAMIVGNHGSNHGSSSPR